MTRRGMNSHQLAISSQANPAQPALSASAAETKPSLMSGGKENYEQTIMIMAGGTGGHISRPWPSPTRCASVAGRSSGWAIRRAWKPAWCRSMATKWPG